MYQWKIFKPFKSACQCVWIIKRSYVALRWGKSTSLIFPRYIDLLLQMFCTFSNKNIQCTYLTNFESGYSHYVNRCYHAPPIVMQTNIILFQRGIAEMYLEFLNKSNWLILIWYFLALWMLQYGRSSNIYSELNSIW